MKPQYNEGYGYIPVMDIHAMPALTRFSPAYWGLAKHIANLNLEPIAPVLKNKASKAPQAKAPLMILDAAFVEAKMREARKLRADKAAELITAAIAGIRIGIAHLTTMFKGTGIVTPR